MESELKACPFCSDPMQVRGDHIQHVTQTPGCPMRDLALPEERVADWNTRAPDPAERAQGFIEGRDAAAAAAALRVTGKVPLADMEAKMLVNTILALSPGKAKP